MDGGGLRWTAEEASTIGGIATVSLLHSFIPTHWLPFSIVARAQRWPLSRTLLVSQYPSSISPPPRASFSPTSCGRRSLLFTLPPDLGPNLLEGGCRRASKVIVQESVVTC